MGVQHNFGTAGATGGGYSAWQGTLQHCFDDRLYLIPSYDWQRRGPKTWRDRNQWLSYWPTRGVAVCGGIEPGQAYCPIGSGIDDGAAPFEPFSCDGEGSSIFRFMRGTCVDADNNAVANAIVQAFRTDTDAFLGQVQANNDGTYLLAVDVPAGTQIYLVAYKQGSPDIGGTTVNTLTPTNVDGT